MDNATSSTTTPPFANAAPTANTPSTDATAASTSEASLAAPLVDSLLKRVTQGAHDAVDNLAAKVSSTVDGLQGGVSKVTDTRDEWVGSVRDAIRAHPFATVAGALIVGAALLSLTSRRDR
ncbi:MAG: hypothetical protein ABJD97_10795 [Betaproteobacteria bacterium]